MERWSTKQDTCLPSKYGNCQSFCIPCLREDNCDTQFSEFRNRMLCVAAVERKACKSEVILIHHRHPSKQIHVPLIYDKLLDFLSVV